MTHNYVNEFHDSMNEHGNAQYKAIPPYVIELERSAKMNGEDTGFLRIWKRPEGDLNPREERWTKMYDRIDSWEETKEEYDKINSKYQAEILIE